VSDDRTPVLIGAGQLTQRDVDPATAIGPLEMMEEVTRRAADDARAGARLLAEVDRVGVVNVFSWPYANAPRLLAERLGAHPTEELYTTVGGNTPQSLVSETAGRIAAGQVRIALLAGAEAVASATRARRARVRLAWAAGGTGAPTVIGDARPGTSERELAHGLALPAQIYPLFENALRARQGLDLGTHRAALGDLCSRFSSVAAAHPHAWFREARGAEEIATVTPSNRMVAFPYPKYMNAIMEVDQAAAVLMTSAGTARALGVPSSRWVYLRGACEAHDRWLVSERVDYASSPAIRVAGQRALAMAGLSIDRVDYLDLYSCFPSAVQIGRDMLGIAPDDPRLLTVTGGLAYFGGPGNNYSMHAIATMMDELRARPGTTGLVTALGWFLTKHAVGVYSAAPPDRRWAPANAADPQAQVDGERGPALAAEPHGRATIETYTVLYDREGAPLRGIVIGRLGDGRRFLAGTPEDRVVLEGLVASEAIGRPGHVRTDDGLTRFDPI
jgi:acetyl-CoA C-acetyltransferase